MLDIDARPDDGFVEALEQDAQASDWELVIRESHHRMKNTLTLLGVSIRRDFLRRKSKDFSVAVDRFERRVVAFGKLYNLLSSNADLVTVSAGEFFGALCRALSEAVLEPAGIR